MLRTETEKYKHLIIKIIAVLFIALISYLAVTTSFKYFSPFILAFILSMVLEPIVQFFQKLKLGRGISVFLSIILFLGTFITFSIFAFTRVIFELGNLYRKLPNMYDEVVTLVTHLAQKATDFYLQLPPEANSVTQDILKKTFDQLTAFLTHTTTAIINTLTALPGVLIFLLITIIATFFLTKDKYFIKEFIFKQLPPSWGNKLMTLKNDLFIALIGFLKAESIILSITFFESFIGLTFMGIDFAFIVAIIIAMVDILPVLGTGSIYVPWAIVNFILGNYKLGIGLLVLYGIITTVRYMIEPKIVGKQLGIHPLLTLMSMFAGLKLLGVAGLILGPTTVVTIKACQNAGILPRFK